MQLGMIGLGRMGANMVRRLMRGGHRTVAFDHNYANVNQLAAEGATGAADLSGFVKALTPPRAVWLMVPAAAVDSTLSDLAPLLSSGDIVVDGGNSYYIDDLRRSRELGSRRIHYLDAGVSGGVWGLERGYCLMVGGDAEPCARLEPVFRTLAPESGYLRCGPSGAGHFVKMVHNGIEYGMMQALAEGLNILKHAGVGRQGAQIDAETAPLRHPEYYQYDLDVPAVAEVWRHGSVISSWLLELTAKALQESPDLAGFSGRVSDSGEGRWTNLAAIEESVPAPVLSTALYARFASRAEATFADKLLSAMRYQFGGHKEKSESGS